LGVIRRRYRRDQDPIISAEDRLQHLLLG
jgi:hypothetical protein